MTEREVQCMHSKNISECAECYPVFLAETSVDTTQDDWLDTIWQRINRTGIYHEKPQPMKYTEFKATIIAHYAQPLVEAKKLQDAIARVAELYVYSGMSLYDPVIARAVDSLKITFADGQLAALAPQEETTERP